MQASPLFSELFVFAQMNFWQGRLHYPIQNFLNREKPDILAAQEMLCGPHDLATDFCTDKTLLERKFFTHYALGGNRPFMMFKNVVYDMYCATFIKEKVTVQAQSLIHFQQHEYFPVDRAKENYFGLLHATLRLKDGALVHVLNHHGYLVIENNGRMGSPLNDFMFKKIADYIAGLSGPIILSGDFNMVKEARSFQPLKDLGLKNLNDIYNISVARNEFSWKADEAVSHIFINDAVVVEDYRIPNDPVSDHLALLLSCRVKI